MKNENFQSINQKGLDLIKRAEDCASTLKDKIKIADFSQLKNLNLRIYPYKCAAKVATIGWGNTSFLKLNPKASFITLKKADELLEQDLEYFETELNSILSKYNIKLNSNQFSALISFVFNLGFGSLLMYDRQNKNYKPSKLMMQLMQDPDDENEISHRWKQWIFVAGAKNPSILKRREAELKLYFTPT